MSLIHFISAKAEQPFGTVQMRCLQPMELLRQNGWETAFFHFTGVDLHRTPDVAVFHRLPQNRVTEALLAYYKNRGVRVIYDTDDLIFGTQAMVFEGRFERLMSKVDAISVSTPFLLEEARSHGWDTYLNPNYLSKDLIASTIDLAAKPKNALHLFYASGSHTHDRDLEMIAEQLIRFLNEHQEARLTIVGKVHVPEVLQNSAQVDTVGFVPYEHYPELLAKAGTMLVPLDLDNPFNLARSEIKYLEACACGVRTISSPIPVMQEWTKWDDQLILCPKEEWYSALCTLANSSENTFSPLEARERVLTKRSPTQAIEWWNEMLAPVAASKDAQWNAQRLTYSLYATGRRTRLGWRNKK